jgi:hypothetical protein
MTARQLFRLSGAALLIGSVLGILSGVVSGILFPDTSDPTVASNLLNVVLTALGVIGGVLALFGLPGLYLSRAQKGGVVWFTGNVLLGLTAVLFGIFLPLVFLLVLPALASAAPALLAEGPPPSFVPLFIIGTLANVFGAAFTAWAVLGRRLYPSWCGWLLALEAVLAALGFFLNGPSSGGVVGQVLNAVSALPLFVVLGWVGYQLWTGGLDAEEHVVSVVTAEAA